MESIQIKFYSSDPLKFDENDPFHFHSSVNRWNINSKLHTWRPPTDLIETDDAYIVRIEIAGMNVEDFTITYKQNILTIDGTRWEKYPDCAFHQLEIPSGDFSSSVEIPSPINENAVAAVYENGFLHITLPKAKIRKIKVN